MTQLGNWTPTQAIECFRFLVNEHVKLAANCVLCFHISLYCWPFTRVCSSRCVGSWRADEPILESQLAQGVCVICCGSGNHWMGWIWNLFRKRQNGWKRCGYRLGKGFTRVFNGEIIKTVFFWVTVSPKIVLSLQHVHAHFYNLLWNAQLAWLFVPQKARWNVFMHESRIIRLLTFRRRCFYLTIIPFTD